MIFCRSLAGKRTLEAEIGDVHLVHDALQKELELRKTVLLY